MSSLDVSLLRKDEREELLDLLDLWPQSDGWSGRDFFRRYIEDDLGFQDENYVLGREAGALVACVQIFPRPVRMRGQVVPMGGIGSVFTRPGHRGRGFATRLLEFSTERMRERGTEVSLLFGVRPVYSALGWQSWGARVWLLSRGHDAAAKPPPGIEIEAFDRVRDLEAVREIHASYSADLDGTVVRDDRLWETSLRVAGNPGEEFRVARRNGEVVAYVRGVVVEYFLSISEAGRRPDGAEALAALVGSTLGPRSPDPLASTERPSPELRKLVALPGFPDADFHDRLRVRGISARRVDDPSLRWRCLDPEGLARRLGVERDRNEGAEDLLRRAFPPRDFTCWPADRF